MSEIAWSGLNDVIAGQVRGLESDVEAARAKLQAAQEDYDRLSALLEETKRLQAHHEQYVPRNPA